MWHLETKETLIETRPFSLERLAFRDKGTGKLVEQDMFRFVCPDWVNVLPVTREGEIVLIRQFRFGTLTNTLETPGGVVESAEKDTTVAALRELEEETGYTTSRILSLGSLSPNPALQSNRIHMFVALDCAPKEPRTRFPDALEQVVVERVPIAEVETLVRTGRIDSALCCLTIMLAKKYVAKL